VLDRGHHALALDRAHLGRDQRAREERILAEVLVLAPGVPGAVDVDHRAEDVAQAGAVKFGAEHLAIGLRGRGIP